MELNCKDTGATAGQRPALRSQVCTDSAFTRQVKFVGFLFPGFLPRPLLCDVVVVVEQQYKPLQANRRPRKDAIPAGNPANLSVMPG